MNDRIDDLAPWRRRRVLLVVGGAALAAALALALLRPAVSEFDPEARLAGANEALLPRISPEEAGLVSDELELAARYAERFGTTALVVARNGHVVYEYYAPDFDRRSLIDARALAPALARVALRAARDDRLPIAGSTPLREDAGSAPALAHAIETAAGEPYAAYVSENVWTPLGAADAYLWRAGESESGDEHAACCLHATTEDLVRLGELLVNDGLYRGEQIVSASTIPARESFAGSEGLRLWLILPERLVVLRTGSEPGTDSGWDDARIPAMMARAADGDGARDPREAPDPALFAPH